MSEATQTGAGSVPLPHAGEAMAADGIDLLEIAAAFVMEWRLVVVTWALVWALCIVFTYMARSRYVATASILPESDRAHGGSIADLFSSRSPGSLFIGLLRSRGVADDITDRLHLMEKLKTKSRGAARAYLAGNSGFEVGGDSILTITIKDEDAQEAAAIANAYVSALQDLNDAMTADQNRQLRSFYEIQLAQERGDLTKAEGELEQTERKTGLIEPATQTQIGISTIAGTRAQITGLEVQLAALLQSDTEQNPQVQRLRSQIAQLQAQERAQEAGGKSPLGAAPSAGLLPQTNLDYQRAQREVKYHDTLMNSLADQFEAARLGEGTSRPAFEVIDRAIVPESKSWPPRKLFVIAGFACGALLGLFAVLVKLVVLRIVADPGSRASLAKMRGAFGGR